MELTVISNQPNSFSFLILFFPRKKKKSFSIPLSDQMARGSKISGSHDCKKEETDETNKRQ